ncbi:MAG: amidotransferase 1, exosortase A system-associated [Alphaproteobacteria bacterium]|nr:amidotransferase 1, exosortase A system-associated [Alphaproteobacteria bacterium]
MCGIAGIFDSRGYRPVDRNLLISMNDVQSHRGPDGDGVFFEDGIGLGHRRLSIIDLDGGAQPLFNEDHTVVVVFNGEIYNFVSLSKELKEKGHQFRTHCDTEVIVHAWEEWGEKCLDRFRGMFAFALWDKNAETLFLARDRFGIKPLFYTVRPDGTVLFGSELKAVLLDPDTKRVIDPQAVEEYFAYGYVPDPKTIYSGIHKLAPGHSLTLRRGERTQRPRKYWDVEFAASEGQSDADVAGDLIERLRDAVECRMISEVPLGAFLSGGVDSSGIVAMMASLSGDSVNTCSIGFGDPKFDETSHAQTVANRYATNHRVEQIDPSSYDLLEKLAGLYDEPFADSSAMPTYRVCELARKHVTVALSGDGGDEVFGGYRRHRWHCYEESFRRLIPDSIRRPTFGLAGALYPKMDWGPRVLRAKSTLQAIARTSVEGYFNTVSVIYDDIRDKLYSTSFRSSLQGYSAREVLAGHMNNAGTDDPLSQIQYADMKTYLPGDILTKVDRASMAHSLEVRVPLLDHEFVEWATTLPSQMNLRHSEGKYIFKKALEDHLPSDVMYRPKMGFAVPISGWFRNELRDRVRDALTGPVLADTGFFDMEFLGNLVVEHQSGVREHSAILWSLLMFEAFLRQINNVGVDRPAFT